MNTGNIFFNKDDFIREYLNWWYDHLEMQNWNNEEIIEWFDNFNLFAFGTSYYINKELYHRFKYKTEQN